MAQQGHFQSLSEKEQIADIHARLVEFGFDNGHSAEDVDKAVTSGFTEPAYPTLVTLLCNQLSALYGLEETVTVMQSPAHLENFLFELSSLLTELDCTDHLLTTGDLNDRFKEKLPRIRLLHFLLAHMKPARLTALKRLREEENAQRSKRQTEAEALYSILSSLKIQPTESSTVDTVFASIEKETQKHLTSLRRRPEPLLKSTFSEKQWKLVENVAKQLNEEFAIRVDLVMKRLDVTVESFLWSDRVQKLEKQIMGVYKPGYARLQRPGKVHVEDLIGATSDHLLLYKASSAHDRKERAKEITGYTLKEVPSDRGGRTGELVGLPNESFHEQRGGRGGGGYRGGGGRRGGGHGGGGGGGGRQFRNQAAHHVETQVKQQWSSHGEDGGGHRGGRGGGGGGHR
ncbi:hypothetical protein AAVH_21552, partial [Aphelenchoides avenae]